MSGPSDKEEEARLMVRMRQAHSMALQRTAAKVGPEVLQTYVAPLHGRVGETDVTALAAKVVARVVEKSEGAFAQLCEDISVNKKLLLLERAKEQQEQRRQQQQQRTEEFMQSGDVSTSDVLGQTVPLPGGRRPDELVRETTMRLKVAERARLLALAEEAERAADAEAARVAAIEASLEERLARMVATQQALAEASSSLR